ncbi:MULTISPECIES: ABC transporter permease [unclassified Thomasclavelia]|uniref:ABC transporter permease n=1 Tax=unclassified Thomasclavelia TaxID=3025756 RepID=UPI000B389D62|nr:MULTISPECIES: ABC transporter permease [unclassified Thomasclavelia]OUP79165.1 ABC transporter permease [Erysipelatoclostridium sp. An173]OUQ09210.1 ABC transporter permease [Erysipelatoclostridium sp. An15]WRK54758.1 ABC transporter permease [Coprobacillaceae bacterium CR2/5/TPMF4]
MGLFYTFLGAVDLGLIWGFLALGVYITFRLLDIADLTVDGSFTTGGAVCAVCVLNGIHPLLALLISILAGFLAGAITGILHTKCKIPAILAGILTQIGLYSINLRIMGGRANLPLTTANTLFADLSVSLDINRYYIALVISLIFVIIFIALLYWFFGTELGSAIRATGNNEQMARSLGINTDTMKLLGLTISNGLVGLSGALYALYGQATDVRVGTGAIVIALASIVIGEVVISSKKGNFALRLTSIIIGSIIYRIIVALVLQMGLNTDDLKLLTAILVGIALTIPIMLNKRKQISMYKKLTGKEINQDA